MAITVTAGQRLTAAMLNAFVPKFLSQSSDQALSTTTFTDHNTFTAITIGAGEVWAVDMYCSISSAHEGNGVKFRWEFTGTATSVRRHILSLAASVTDVTNQNVNLQVRPGTTSVSGGVGNTGDDPSSWQEHVIVSGGVSGGTYGVEWAQQAATSGATTINGSGASWLVAHRLQ